MAERGAVGGAACRHWGTAAVLVLVAALAGPVQAQPVGGDRPAEAATSAPAPTESRPSTQPGGETIEQLYDASQKAANGKDFAAAREYLRRALAIEPKNLRLLASMASASAELKDAGETFRYSLAAAETALDLRQYGIAEQYFLDVAATNPEEPRMFLGLAQVYAATNRETKAIDTYRRYQRTEAGQNDYRGYLAMGRQYLANKFHRQAISALRRADQLNPRNAEILSTLAKAYRSVHDFAAATEMAARAIAADPGNPNYAEAYASTLLEDTTGDEARRAARLDEAQQVLQRGLEAGWRQLERTPDDIGLIRSMSQACRTLDRLAQVRWSRDAGKAGAETLLVRARAIQEAAALDQTLQLHEALDVLNAAAGQAPGDLKVLQELAAVQYQVKKLPDAAETCRRILASDPDHAFARELLQKIGPVTTRPAAAP